MQDIKAGWVLLRFFFVAKHLYLTDSKHRFWEGMQRAMESPMRPYKDNNESKFGGKKSIFFKGQKTLIFQFLR